MAYLLHCDDINGCGYEYPGDLKKCPKCETDNAFSYPALIDPRLYVYDIETYPNIFTCCFIHLATGQVYQFEISDRVNHAIELYNFVTSIASMGARCGGYNNEHFDYSVMHYVLNNAAHVTVDAIYNYAMAVIKSKNQFEFSVWESDRLFEQIDLFKIWHFDNKAKRTSLKALEIAMRMDNVQDLPFEVGTYLDDNQKNILHNYNVHDCEATARLMVRTLPQIKLRETLSQKFGKSFTNKNDVKMGEMILVGELEKNGIHCHERIGGRKVKKQTHRASISLNECIFPYVQFERPEFQMIRNYLANQVITETKGVFSEIPATREMVKMMDPERVKVYGYNAEVYRKVRGVITLAEHKSKKAVKLSNIPYSIDDIPGDVTFEAENLHCVVDGLRYDFGTGGLHASVTSRIVVTDNEGQIVDVDVASFYPNLGIVNKMFPAHLGVEFCDAYLGVYHTRKSYDKSLPENGAFKLALNGAYGGSNNEYSPFYDPKYTMMTTINGQLMLCMLVEQILKVPGLKMVQANTDGITYKCPHEYIEHQRAVCKWWEQNTLLELEEALYSRMFIRDVNSYIAEKVESGELKRIGTYAHETPDQNPATREIVWHKNPSQLIVPKVAERVLVHGEDARTLIENWNDPFDFLIRAKVSRSDKLFIRWPEYNTEQQVQNTTRYFVSKNGGELIKVSPPSGVEGSYKRAPGVKDALYNVVMAELIEKVTENFTPGNAPSYDEMMRLIPWDERIHTKSMSVHATRETGECAGWRVTDCADIKNFDMNEVNFDYYVNEVEKIVKPLIEGDTL